jgi:hypothetical protein
VHHRPLRPAGPMSIAYRRIAANNPTPNRDLGSNLWLDAAVKADETYRASTVRDAPVGLHAANLRSTGLAEVKQPAILVSASPVPRNGHGPSAGDDLPKDNGGRGCSDFLHDPTDGILTEECHIDQLALFHIASRFISMLSRSWAVSFFRAPLDHTERGRRRRGTCDAARHSAGVNMAPPR